MTTAIQPLVTISNLDVFFPCPHFREKLLDPMPYLKAVNGVSLEILPGQVLGVVGESGAGKSTLGRAIARLLPVTRGSIRWRGGEYKDNHQYKGVSNVQMVFQDPLASLNPRMTIAESLLEPLRNRNKKATTVESWQQIKDMLNKVELVTKMLYCYPHELSGGQCQRVCIARALISRPDLIVCDEPVSALDSAMSRQIINLFKSLQSELSIALLFISHDLSLVKYLCEKTFVMYAGFFVESGFTHDLFESPRHPYTQSLIAALPTIDFTSTVSIPMVAGELPSAVNLPSGCVFESRCPVALPECKDAQPALLPSAYSHSQLSACIRTKAVG